LENKGQMKSDWGMLYTVGQFFLKTIRCFPCILKMTWFEKDMNNQNFETIRIPILGFPLGSPEEKWHLDVVPMERHRIYYGGGVMPPPKGFGLCKTCV